MAAPTHDDLLASYSQGTMADDMAHRFGARGETEVEAIRAGLATLHNAGTIDLLTLVENEKIQSLDGPSFFMATHFLCRILPNLSAATQRVMDCVEALVARGGSDLSANFPNSAFRDWCSRDLARAREIIGMAQAGDPAAGRNLTFALEALGDIPEARRILAGDNRPLRLSAITALGRLNDSDPASREETVRKLGEVLDDAANDAVKVSLLHAVAFVTSQDEGTAQSEAVGLMARLLVSPSDMMVHHAAQVIGDYPQTHRPELIHLLLAAIRHLNPANKGTVEKIDFALTALLQSGHDRVAIDFVTELFEGPGELKLTELVGFLRALADGPADRLGRTVVSWLRSGALRLCDGLANELWRHRDDQPILDLQDFLKDLPLPELIFVCRKAMGFFFMRPRSAASVLVSGLRICEDDTLAEEIQEYLQWMLLNYGGIREYLSQIGGDDPARMRVDAALAANTAYLSKLKSIPELKEFQPSEPQRRIEHLRMADQMRTATKAAESKSVLLSLVSRSVLLYGSRSLSFIGDNGNQLRPVETELKSFSTSFELPRLEVVDPIGLNHTLWMYRAERLEQ